MDAALDQVLKAKGSEIYSVDPSTSVHQCVTLMNQRSIGAVMVVDDGVPVGIFSERDVMCRVIDPELNPATTPVGDVMTSNLVCTRPETRVSEAMLMLKTRKIRHLPVLDDGKMIGIVSINDLVNWMVRGQAEEIAHLEAYIAGNY